jgi:hypothetical protein
MGLLLSLAASETRAQASHERLEISTQYTSLHLSITDSTEAGIGTRLGYNINDYLAVEAEGNYFPRYSLGNDSLDDKAQGLIGVKAGRRYGRVGAFGKLRAGVVNFYGLRIREGLCVFNPETSICRAGPRSPSRFAMDAGAVIEVYPIRRLIVRADVGDTMIRFKDDSLLDDRGIRVRAPDGISHNFQFTLAVGFRF